MEGKHNLTSLTVFRNRYRISSGHTQRGSMAVEAALVFPFFFFAVLTLSMLFIYIQTCYRVQKNITYAVYEISGYGEVFKAGDEVLSQALKFDNELVNRGVDLIKGSLSDLVFRNCLREKLRKNSYELRYIQGGIDGMDFFGTTIDTDGQMKVECSYYVKLPVHLPVIKAVKASNSLSFRTFTGTKYTSYLTKGKDDEDEEQSEQEKEDDRTVYITDSGKVYHNSLDCPAIRINLKAVSYSLIETIRNNSHGRYYPCEKCAHGEPPQMVYVTEEGNRYHYSTGCSTLKRTVREVKLSEVNNRRECKKCFCGEE